MYSQLKKIKVHLDKLLKPLMLALSKFGVKPYQLSILSLIAGFIGAYYFGVNWLLSLLFMGIWFILDVSDGTLARATKSVSPRGVWLDFLIDRLVLVMILYRYYVYSPDSQFYVLLALLVVLMLTIGELVRK